MPEEIRNTNVFVGGSFDSCTSATGRATGSVSLRVMVSGGAVMPAWEIWTRSTEKQQFQQLRTQKSAGEEAANQAAIRALSSAEWNPATLPDTAASDSANYEDVVEGSPPWPDPQHLSATGCAALYLCLHLQTLSSIVPATGWYLCAHKLTFCTFLHTFAYVCL